jgi:Flp pilus assembly protein TadG
MRMHSRRSQRSQRSQAMTEFALVAPVLLLLTFGIMDFGRALFFYAAAGDAAREAAHVALRATSPLPTNADVTNAVSVHFPGATVSAPSPACVNGPIPGGIPAAGNAWVFITDPNPAVAGETAPPANAPGGQAPGSVGAPCSPVVPAIGNQVLEVTVIYNFVPVTPLVSSAIGNHIVFTLRVLARTEY